MIIPGREADEGEMASFNIEYLTYPCLMSLSKPTVCTIGHHSTSTIIAFDCDVIMWEWDYHDIDPEVGTSHHAHSCNVL